jgi:hypothetical protein
MADNPWEFAAGIYNYDNMEDSFDDARDYVDTGFNKAEDYTEQYHDPYVQHGQWGIEGYEGMGEFDFDYSKYLDTDFYDWLKEDQLKQLNRQYAASPQGYYSGGTYVDTLRDMNQFMGTQYGAEHDRQLAGYGKNLDRYGNAISTGQKSASDAAETMADISIARGGTMAGLELGEAQAGTSILASLFSDRGTGTGGAGGAGGAGGTGGIGGSSIPDPTGGLLSGTGLNTTGQWGILGDIGAAIIGRPNEDVNWGDFFGTDDQLSILDGIEELTKNLSAEDLDYYMSELGDFTDNEIFGVFEGLKDSQGNQYYDPANDFFGDLDYNPWEDIGATLEDDGFWSSLSNGLENIWDATGGAFIDWVSDFFD